jgi:hypothetical protein
MNNTVNNKLAGGAVYVHTKRELQGNSKVKGIGGRMIPW